MNLIISFSGRNNGNCDSISEYIASKDDTIIHFRNLNIHECSGCNYECFDAYCKYHQDDSYETIISKLYIIGVHGDSKKSPDFIPCLSRCFEGTQYHNHVLEIERHKYNQKIGDNILYEEEVKNMLTRFIQQ